VEEGPNTEACKVVSFNFEADKKNLSLKVVDFLFGGLGTNLEILWKADIYLSWHIIFNIYYFSSVLFLFDQLFLKEKK